MSHDPLPPRQLDQRGGGSGWIIGLVLGGVALLLVGAAVFVLGAWVMWASPVASSVHTTIAPVGSTTGVHYTVPTSPPAGSAVPPGMTLPPPVLEVPAAPDEPPLAEEGRSAAATTQSAGDDVALADPAAEASKKEAAPEQPGWVSLFNGKNLDGWNLTKFGGEGDVEVKDGAIILGRGNDMTGVTLAKDPPAKINYELQLQARRVDGTDFFCGLTFPVKNETCSLILGGWGGGVTGLSSINGMDASENATTGYQEFKNGSWYDVRLRVSDHKIEAWLDKEQIVDQDTRDRELGVRVEVELSKPLGLATWQTTGAVKNIRLRKLTDAEVKAIDATLEDE
jgi:hypothetical protein